jgi:hypothetical protein
LVVLMKRCAGASQTFLLVLMKRWNASKRPRTRLILRLDSDSAMRNTFLNTFLDTHTRRGVCVDEFLNQNPVDENQTIEALTKPTDPTPAAQTAKPAKTFLRGKLVEKIRAELNIEKWPAIWQPAKSKNKPGLRTMEREVLAADGSRTVSRVEVGYTQLGTLTTEEQKLLYVLIKFWEDAGKPDVQVFFSTRGVARMLKKKGWGTNVIHSVTKSLRKLRTIPIEWINSYYDKTETGAVVVDRRPFTILGDLRIVERRQDGAVNSSLGYFKFDDHILSNLLRNFTKPVCIEEFFKLKSEIAQLVYSHIDLMLFDKTKYERRSKDLFDDLGLKNPEYSHMFERKRALERAMRELEGIRLSSGTLRVAAVEKTKDGKDYKVSFQKATRAEIDEIEVVADAPSLGPVVINDYSKQKDPLRVQAEELVRYFHKIFHGVDGHVLMSKETDQALTLVVQHGLEKSKGVVEFAQGEAAKTNFQIQHFGAVLSYAHRALSVFNRRQVDALPASQVADHQARPRQEEKKTWKRGEARMAALTEEQYRARFERTKSALFQEHSFLARNWKDGSKMHEQAVRARIIRELETEPMELVLLPPWLTAMCRWQEAVQKHHAHG